VHLSLHQHKLLKLL